MFFDDNFPGFFQILFTTRLKKNDNLQQADMAGSWGEPGEGGSLFGVRLNLNLVLGGMTIDWRLVMGA